MYKEKEKAKISKTETYLLGEISGDVTPLRGNIILNEDGSVVDLRNLEECQELIEKVSKILRRPWLC